MANRTCSVEGCERPHKARGWCSPHFARWRHHGDPLGGGPYRREGFWSKVDRRGPDECWLWLAGSSKGYGRATTGGRQRQAHVVAYELLVGPVPEGLELDHLCRVLLCVNPAHLEPVTHRVNLLRGFGASGVNARKTHCNKGHEFTEENTTITPQGTRRCKICDREKARRHYLLSKA